MESKSFKNLQKFNQNQQKINQKSILGGLGAIWASQIRFGTDLDTSWGSTWVDFEAKWGHVWAMLAQKLILGGPGWLSKSTMKFDTFSNRFGSDF